MAAYSQWQAAILKAIGAPVTPENVRALNAWQQAEGGSAAYNPLNTTQNAPGATPYNKVGVRNFASPLQGTQATARTLLNGRYQPIVDLLRSGKADAMAVARAVEQSPWGTGGGVVRVLGGNVSSEVTQGLPTPPQAPQSPPPPPAMAPPSRLAGLLQPADNQGAVSILQQLGGMAGKAATAAQSPISLPAQRQPMVLPQHPSAAAIPGNVDTTPQVMPGGPKPVGGLSATFAQRFKALQNAIHAKGGQLYITSGGRDEALQAQLFNAAVKKYGSEAAARKWVAPPGKSNHDLHAGLKYGLGDGAVASDVKGDLQLAHELAPQFGLAFPLSNEAWHMEIAGLRDIKR